jgi:hypothetical protein
LYQLDLITICIEELAIVLVTSEKNKLSRNKVWSKLALLTGWINFSRVVQSQKKSDEIAQAILSNFTWKIFIKISNILCNQVWVYALQYLQAMNQ